MHFFVNHPEISFDLLKNGQPRNIQNLLARYRVLEEIKDKVNLYYYHEVEEGQSAQFIANRYYGDSELDWIIFIVNDIHDVLYDWPMDYQPFINFIKGKYGSVESALNTVHHYEWIYQSQSIRFDDSIIPEDVIVVDATTYATLPSSQRREVSNYTYEERLNNNKRNIKILENIYLPQLLDEAERIFE